MTLTSVLRDKKRQETYHSLRVLNTVLPNIYINQKIPYEVTVDEDIVVDYTVSNVCGADYFIEFVITPYENILIPEVLDDKQLKIIKRIIPPGQYNITIYAQNSTEANGDRTEAYVPLTVLDRSLEGYIEGGSRQINNTAAVNIVAIISDLAFQPEPISYNWSLYNTTGDDQNLDLGSTTIARIPSGTIPDEEEYELRLNATAGHRWIERKVKLTNSDYETFLQTQVENPVTGGFLPYTTPIAQGQLTKVTHIGSTIDLDYTWSSSHDSRQEKSESYDYITNPNVDARITAFIHNGTLTETAYTDIEIIEPIMGGYLYINGSEGVAGHDVFELIALDFQDFSTFYWTSGDETIAPPQTSTKTIVRLLQSEVTLHACKRDGYCVTRPRYPTISSNYEYNKTQNLL